MAWIGSRRFDLFFFFGSSLFAAGLGVMLMVWPSILVPVLWLWLWLIEGPHLFATWQRTYLDAEERRTRGTLLLGSLVFLLPGVLAFWVSKLFGAPVLFQLMLAIAGVVSWHHAVRQHYGIMAVYGVHARTPPGLWRFDRLMMHGILWGAFALALLALPANRKIIGMPGALPRWGLWLSLVLAGALIVAVLVFAGSIVWRKKKGVGIRPALFALFPVFGLLGFTLFVMGFFEPLFKGARNDEQLVLGMTVVGGAVHGLQYLGIVFAANKRRYANAAPKKHVFTRKPLLSYLALSVVSLLYVAINAARGTMPGLAWFPETGDTAQFFLAVYWGLFFHHYYLDQKIWKVRRDPRLRTELGLT